MASRLPIVLSTVEVSSWQEWIKHCVGADLRHLGLAITRTLRALTERRDASDTLIDSVIAWESLFGATNESVLRVSASLAKLLHSPGEKRHQARSQYQKIYNLRSNIVHGNKLKATPEQIDEYAQLAASAALEAIGILLTGRRELLAMESADRSVRILLEDGEHGTPEEAGMSTED
jgi:hypothetical protein